MSVHSITVTGTLNPDGTLALDERVKLPPGRVRVRVETTHGPHNAAEFLAAMERVWAIRRGSTCPPRSAADIDADIDALRAEFDQRMSELERLQYGTPDVSEG